MRTELSVILWDFRRFHLRFSNGIVIRTFFNRITPKEDGISGLALFLTFLSKDKIYVFSAGKYQEKTRSSTINKRAALSVMLCRSLFKNVNKYQNISSYKIKWWLAASVGNTSTWCLQIISARPKFREEENKTIEIMVQYFWWIFFLSAENVAKKHLFIQFD